MFPPKYKTKNYTTHHLKVIRNLSIKERKKTMIPNSEKKKHVQKKKTPIERFNPMFRRWGFGPRGNALGIPVLPLALQVGGQGIGWWYHGSRQRIHIYIYI